MEKEVFCYLIKIVTTTNNEIVVKHIVKKILEIICEKEFYPICADEVAKEASNGKNDVY